MASPGAFEQALDRSLSRSDARWPVLRPDKLFSEFSEKHGKTPACSASTTVVYCAGASLHHVSSAFNLARMLKPALVVLEDIDLVFSDREINQHASVLGTLFDEIDALADVEPVNLILTSNAIERVESAVKDRPGRVGQCIYFGSPSAELRRRYVLSYLRTFATV